MRVPMVMMMFNVVKMKTFQGSMDKCLTFLAAILWNFLMSRINCRFCKKDAVCLNVLLWHYLYSVVNIFL